MGGEFIFSYIGVPEQVMPQGKDCDLFLNNPHNKTKVIQLLVNQYKSGPVKSKLEIPLTLKEEEKTWLVVKRTGVFRS